MRRERHVGNDVIAGSRSAGTGAHAGEAVTFDVAGVPTLRGRRQQIERDALRVRCHPVGREDEMGSIMMAEVLDGSIDGLGKILRRQARAETCELHGQHGAPVDRDLPRTGFIGKENDAVRIRINFAEQVE